MTIRVVKVGGSLLHLPDLPARLRGWLARQTPAAHLLLAGGGAAAQAVREWDALYGLQDSDAHWLAVRAMSLTADLLAALLPECRRAGSVAAWQTQPPPPGWWLLDAWTFMQEDLRRPEPLPQGWHVTSDSIAARAAQATGAVELVLLKSRPPPPGDCRQLAEAGYVDRYFPQAAAGLQVRYADLRGDG